MARTKRCSRATAPNRGRGTARRESDAINPADSSSGSPVQQQMSDEHSSRLRNPRHKASQRSRSPAADRRTYRDREVPPPRPSPSHRSTRSSTSGSVQPFHSHPIPCPVRTCTLQWMHQHPPCLQYYAPNTNEGEDEGEDSDGEWPFADADLNGPIPTRRESVLPSVEILDTAASPTAHVSMAGFHEDMETSRMILSGEFDWQLPDLGHASTDPSEYQLVPTPQPSTPTRAFLDDVEGLKLDDEPFGTESDCNMDETENEIDNELPSSAMRREPSPYFHGFQLRQSANGVWTGYDEK